MNDGRDFIAGIFLGLMVMAIVFAVGYQISHDRHCLARYTTIDGKYYYWGKDPESDSQKNYFWKSVKVDPNTIFTSIDCEECTWE